MSHRISFNLPSSLNPSPQLRRFNQWINRIHVDIARYKDENLVSIPHIEPDPVFNAIAHLWVAFIYKQEVRGKEAVTILKNFLVIK
jgi:hypothetical protein